MTYRDDAEVATIGALSLGVVLSGYDPYVDVGSADMLVSGEIRQIDVEGKEVLLARIQDQYFAVSNICSHAVGWLDLGTLYPDTCEIECPLHLGRFDLRTGKATHEPCEDPIDSYAVKRTEARLLIDPNANGQ